MVDLTKIDGLNEEQTAQLSALFDQEVGGLKSKVDELLGEKKTVQQGLSEKEQALGDARIAANKLAEEKLIAEGKYAEALELREKETAELTAKLEQEAKIAKDALMDRDKGAVLNQVSSLVHDDYKDLSKPMLSNMLKISYNDQGEAITSFEHEGKVVANNVEEFKGWASEQATLKKILKGVDSSGAGTSQSRSGASMTNKPYSEMTLQERAKLNNT